MIMKVKRCEVNMDTVSAEVFFDDGHSQIHVAHTIDGKADGVFAGIEHAVLAGAVILEQQQAVSVGQCVNILGFTGI